MLWRIKKRLLAAGGIVSILSLVLMAVRGIELPLEGLLAVGLVVLLLGVLWK